MTKLQKIAAKNDLCRSTFLACKVVMTDGVARSPDREAIINAVREFSNFNADNDPHGEHDFGVFEVKRMKHFWKLDYYDRNYEHFQEDGMRVLTILRADEY